MFSCQSQSTASHQTQCVTGRPNKRRRATTSIKTTQPQRNLAPNPLPSATHPPVRRTHRTSDAGASDSDPGLRNVRALPNNHSIPPYTPSLHSNMSSIPTSNGSTMTLPFSPNFAFSPLPQFASLAPSPVPRVATLPSNADAHTLHFDPLLNMPTPYDQLPTPGAGSTSGGSVHTDPDSKDPFLSLLEQLAENEVSRGGPSELDYFLSGQTG